jgi:hypothetical protein
VRWLKNNLIKNIVAKNERHRQEFGTFHLNEDVFVEPHVVRHGDSMSVNYRGLLRNSGADLVYLHYGFDRWNNPHTVRMDRSDDGVFRSEIKAAGSNEINFCFKDSANHWDNNNGYNWNVYLQ